MQFATAFRRIAIQLSGIFSRTLYLNKDFRVWAWAEIIASHQHLDIPFSPLIALLSYLI